MRIDTGRFYEFFNQWIQVQKENKQPYSLTEFSNCIGLDNSTLSRIINNKQSCTQSVVDSIAREFNNKLNLTNEKKLWSDYLTGKIPHKNELDWQAHMNDIPNLLRDYLKKAFDVNYKPVWTWKVNNYTQLQNGLNRYKDFIKNLDDVEKLTQKDFDLFDYQKTIELTRCPFRDDVDDNCFSMSMSSIHYGDIQVDYKINIPVSYDMDDMDVVNDVDDDVKISGYIDMNLLNNALLSVDGCIENIIKNHVAPYIKEVL